ncbi:permease prefix domain 1-containing protein [Shimazuella sp. AN120528]|uniref:permease prefix domain 1-containing protein n=1 Tax=Shimazuella soli TaxID=1892854 RepID=UPI001F1033EC|nr:permease prefix domain 1-containing protein [Shimazuella soli]
MKTLKQHVERLFKDVPESDEKKTIIHEIVENLEEKVQDLMADGKAEEDAINKVIVEFGDVQEIKQELMQKTLSPKKNMSKVNLGFSIWGSLLIIALFVFANFYYTPHEIWFVYPTFVVLWWPLSMLFIWMRSR